MFTSCSGSGPFRRVQSRSWLGSQVWRCAELRPVVPGERLPLLTCGPILETAHNFPRGDGPRRKAREKPLTFDPVSEVTDTSTFFCSLQVSHKVQPTVKWKGIRLHLLKRMLDCRCTLKYHSSLFATKYMYSSHPQISLVYPNNLPKVSTLNSVNLKFWMSAPNWVLHRCTFGCSCVNTGPCCLSPGSYRQVLWMFISSLSLCNQ